MDIQDGPAEGAGRTVDALEDYNTDKSERSKEGGHNCRVDDANEEGIPTLLLVVVLVVVALAAPRGRTTTRSPEAEMSDTWGTKRTKAYEHVASPAF